MAFKKSVERLAPEGGTVGGGRSLRHTAKPYESGPCGVGCAPVPGRAVSAAWTAAA
jgi:hypothetical protein